MATISIPASTPTTALMLYDLVACPRRVAMDLFADPAERDTASPFLQFLWERRAAHEEQVVAGILPEVEVAQ
jgi:hypothetical protein